MRANLLAAVVWCVAAVALAAQAQMRPGMWEIAVQVQMPGAPPMPEMKLNQCVTAEQLQKGPSAVLPNPTGAAGSSECKVTDTKTTGNTVTWSVACTGEPPMTGSGELTLEGDTYKGTMTMNMSGMQMPMKLAAKRVGECKP